MCIIEDTDKDVMYSHLEPSPIMCSYEDIKDLLKGAMIDANVLQFFML